ncbi:hypothetical protein F4561_002690 [Lipingzhangella halophila]|uniref:Uncharacterized protein n=1 Tax=Lipingzhangella halophila TaxID=1783352 RepID=A0A7W7RH37_9ACTN|nr:hypothetical protein [Lipingzhangella halophila]MBB4931870.1 hypothetical protein [Lipingzhangella halophila]
MRTRAMEREELHGPWPTSPEILAADFPQWEIWRDQGEGRHGDWCAQHGERTLRSATLEELRRLLEEAES